MICVICKEMITPDYDTHGNEIWHGGHNPSPVADDGYCCSNCNDTIVTPTRVTEMIIQLNGGKNG
tara:strand:- start:194 stop:388 length:195 start_codon:yes stop_codon:yes gene_type:complete